MEESLCSTSLCPYLNLSSPNRISFSFPALGFMDKRAPMLEETSGLDILICSPQQWADPADSVRGAGKSVGGHRTSCPNPGKFPSDLKQ